MGVGPSKQKETYLRGMSRSPITKSSRTGNKNEKKKQRRAAEEDWQAAVHIARQISHGLRAGVDVRGRLASINLAERQKVFQALCATDPQIVAYWPPERSLLEFQHQARQKQAEQDEWRARENMLARIMKRGGREKCRQEELDTVFNASRSALGLEDRADRSQQGQKVMYTDYRGVRTARQPTLQHLQYSNLRNPAAREQLPQLVAYAGCDIVAPKLTRRMNVGKLEMTQYPSRESSTQDRYALQKNNNRRRFGLETEDVVMYDQE